MKLTLNILLLSVLFHSSAQNLVLNPSFEDTVQCPYENSTSINMELENAIGWTFPTTEGTSDYFNTCAPTSNIWTKVNVPSTFMGFQEANLGNAFAGMYTYYYNPNNGIDYGTEYIQGQLLSPLDAGIQYYLSFRVNSANFSEYNISEIGAYVSQNAINDVGYKPFNVIPQVKSPSGIFLTDTLGWSIVSGSFIANGGEYYVTLGNFNDSITTDTLNTGINYPTGVDGAYYFIDDVCISMNPETCAIYLGTEDMIDLKKKKVIKIIDILGRETENKPNILLIYIYSDGTTEQVFRFE